MTPSDQQNPPPPMADLVGPMVKAAAINAAGELGLFQVLADGPRSIPELASATGASENGVGLLVEALAAVGYLERTDGVYANGATARAWLTPASRVDFTPLLLWAPVTWHLLEDLGRVVRDGGPKPTLYEYLRDRPDLGRILSRYMRALAQLAAEPVAQAVAVPETARRLLDFGGSHGLFNMAFCRRHPELEAVVFDLSTSVAETGETIAAEGLSDRVTVQHGDYLADEIGRNYDIVLCSSLLHNHTRDDSRRLLAKAADAPNPGGLIVVHEFLRSEPPDAFNALYSLLFFLYSGTRNYSFEEIAGWLQEAGFGGLGRADLPPDGQSSIVTAVKTSQEG